MRPNERTFDGWRDLYFDALSGSDAWWDAIDNMFKTAECREDWRRVHEVLEWEERGNFKERFSRARNYEPWRIATNGMLFAHSQSELEALKLARRSWWRKALDAILPQFYFQTV